MNKNLLALKKMVESKLKGNECRTVTIKGVSNISYSDLEDLRMYIKRIETQGNIYGLMTPRGNVEEVFKKYGIEFECTIYNNHVIYR